MAATNDNEVGSLLGLGVEEGQDGCRSVFDLDPPSQQPSKTGSESDQHLHEKQQQQQQHHHHHPQQHHQQQQEQQNGSPCKEINGTRTDNNDTTPPPPPPPTNNSSNYQFPEGGWGWVVVVASFCNSFIFDGIASSFGVLYPYLLARFQASAFLTSFAGSMLGAYLIMGSATAALISKFGFRPVSFAGGLMCCVAMVAASKSPNIYLFLLCFGVFGGVGVGLVYLSSMVIVNGYFNEKRGITNGIISSGSGMGLLVMAPLINCLLDNYSLNGTILILGGVMLNICVFSALFREPKVYSSSDSDSDQNLIEVEVEDCKVVVAPCEKSSEDTEDGTEESTLSTNSQEQICIQEEQQEKSGDGVEMINVENTEQGSHPAVVLAYMDHVGHGINRAKYLDKCFGKSDNFLFKKFQTDHSLSPQGHSSMQNVFNKLTASNPRPARSHHSNRVFLDIGTNSYLSGSISRLMQIHRQQFLSYNQLQTAPSKSNLSFDTNKDELGVGLENCQLSEQELRVSQEQQSLFSSQFSLHSRGNSTCENVSLCSAVYDTQPLGYSIRELLRKLSFHLFYCGACLIQFGYPVPGIFLADLAASHSISSYQSAIMISLIGSFNIGGRLLAGFMGNLNINPVRLNNIAMLLAAILCFLCPLYTTMWSLSVFAALYGFLLGFFPPLQPLIIVKYFGIGSLASTFGFVTSLKGVAGLIGPPLAGWIYDVSSDYSISIIFAGVAFLLSVIVNEIMVFVIDRERK